MEMSERDWSSLPLELFALVAQKVEHGAGARGEGRRLVALAGVCRAWRRSLHREWQQRALLTFPAAIRHRGANMECLLKKTGDTFTLVQRRACGDEYFLLIARKRYTIGSSYFRISTDPKRLWTDDAISVKSNFWRTTFTLQDAVASPTTNLSVHFEEVAVDGNCQRKVRCDLDTHLSGDRRGEVGWRPAWLTAVLKWNHLLQLTTPLQNSVKKCPASNPVKKITSRSVNESTTFSLKSKDPDWHQQEQCWSLDFNGRASAIAASIHNFQLVANDSSDGKVILQLGKLWKGHFVLDFGAPLSPLEAFAIALSSFATSVGLDA